MTYFSGSIPFKSAAAIVSESTTAPAASVGPSLPSVPEESIVIPGLFCSRRADNSARCWFLPPFPLPLTFTTVSPPNKRHTGFTSSLSLLNFKAVSTRYSATVETSPCSLSSIMIALILNSKALFLAASSATLFEPTSMLCVLPKTGSLIFGVSGLFPMSPSFRIVKTSLGTSVVNPYISSTVNAWK